jgi:hypothetical protein
LAAGPSWPNAVTGLQIVISLIAFIAIVEVGIKICIGLRAAVAAALAAAHFQLLLYDQAISRRNRCAKRPSVLHRSRAVP